MKITEINEKAMRELKPGDVIEFACGGKAEIVKRNDQNNDFPHILWLKSYKNPWTFDNKGCPSYGASPLDIKAIIKAAPEIPVGFIPWHGGVCPVDRGVEVEVILRNSKRITTEGSWLDWLWTGETGIIAYRPVTTKQQGEIWAVVWPDKSVSIRADKNIYGFASERKPIAIIPLGKWAEGDGLELLEGKNESCD